MAGGRNSARRRRVILDDAVQQAGAVKQNTKSSIELKKAVDLKNSYGDAAKRRGQLKTTDLIPKRAMPIAIVGATVVLFVVMINFLAVYSKTWTSLSEDAIHSLGFSGAGTISAWFSSLLLLITGMASLQIYGMRRHRFDDYSGHYRIWLFLSVLFLVASANCVINFNEVATSLARVMGLGNETNLVVFLLAKLIALTALAVRGFLEIRASRAAIATVTCVWIAYAFSIVMQIPAIKNEMVSNHEFYLGNGILFGNAFLFFAVILYARFVYLHANALIKLETVAKKSNVRSVSDRKPENTEVATKSSADSSNGLEITEALEKTNATPAVEEQGQILQLPHDTLASKSKSGKKSNKKSRKAQRRAA